MTAGPVRSARSRPRQIMQALYSIYALLVFALWIVASWIAVYFAPSRRVAARITTSALRSYFVVIGCRVQVRGREHLAGAGARVLVCNHTSYADVLVLLGAIGADYQFVAKIEARKIPFIGTFLRRLGHFAIDRRNPRARVRQFAQIENALRLGQSVLLFPEGTFTQQEGVRPFHIGAFKAAVHTRCPIVPIALQGTRRLLPDGSYLPRRTAITLTICPPLEPTSVAGSPEWKEMVRLRDAAREAISQYAGEPLL